LLKKRLLEFTKSVWRFPPFSQNYLEGLAFASVEMAEEASMRATPMYCQGPTVCPKNKKAHRTWSAGSRRSKRPSARGDISPGSTAFKRAYGMAVLIMAKDISRGIGGGFGMAKETNLGSGKGREKET